MTNRVISYCTGATGGYVHAHDAAHAHLKASAPHTVFNTRTRELPPPPYSVPATVTCTTGNQPGWNEIRLYGFIRVHEMTKPNDAGQPTVFLVPTSRDMPQARGGESGARPHYTYSNRENSTVRYAKTEIIDLRLYSL